MLYDESTASLLKMWLIKTLQPVCDADPEALADYVLALLKHDAAEPDLRKMFVSQLEEFLEEEASKFVDTLFAALRSKSYLPYEPIKSEDHQLGIPIPLDDLVSDRGRKRNLETDEDERPSPKGPRLSSDGSFSRFIPPGRRNTSINGRGGLRGEGPSSLYYPQGGRLDPVMHMYRPPHVAFGGRGRRGICRDYYKNGFCARGSLCQYSHGDDAVVPPMLYTMPGVPPFMPVYPAMASLMSNATYDPHESRMEMGDQQQRASSRHMGDPVPSTELPVVQDLTPRDPVEEASKGEPMIQPNGFTHNFGTPRRMQQQQTHIMPPNISPLFPEGMVDMFNMGLSVPPTSNDPSLLHQHQHQNNMSAGVGAFKQGSKALFPGDSHPPRHAPRDDKTLVVEKIPDEKLSMEAINVWFKKFGTVTNVAIDSSSGKALVTFSNHVEAQNAWKSEEAIFGNRFVKVFWHRPLEGQGTIGQRALAASASFMKNLSTDSPSRLRSHQESPPVELPTPKLPPTNAAALAARQRALEQQISQQKVLISRLGAAKTSQEKEEIMESLKSLQNKPLPPSQSTSSTDTSPQDPALSKSKLSDERVGLDQDLDSRAEQEKISSEDSNTKESQQTAALLEKLSLLKAEATRIGVPDVEINSNPPITSRLYKPYRGRGGFRGRGFTAGARGGPPPRGSMKLDNRPRRLLVQGVPSNDEAIQAVRTYYQNLGNLELFGKLEEDGQVVVQFWSRATAESALASGADIPSVGKVKVSWHSGPTPSFIPVSIPSRTADSATKIKDDYADSKDNHTDGSTVVVPDAEESGWGQSFDDEGESRRRRSRSRSFS